MSQSAAAPDSPMARLLRPDFWTAMTWLTLAVLFVLLILPIFSVLSVSFIDPKTGAFSLANYVQVFTRPYYLTALSNTLLIGTLGTLGACLLGVPLAYCTARLTIRGRTIISTLAILVLVAPPFIGAYAWIMMFGSNGFITNAMKSIGLPAPTIYGLPGIIFVFSFKLFPYIYLMTETALNAVNKSLEDAAENMGCTAFQRFMKVTLPLVFPAVSTGAIIAFVLSIADFGTPALLGRGVRTLSTIAYTAYTSELGGQPSMAVTISLVMVMISMVVLLGQRYILSKRRYASALTNRPVRYRITGWRSIAAHVFCYGVVGIAMLPAAVVFYTSLLKTRGPAFIGGFGLESYSRVLYDAPEAIVNSFSYALAAVALIAVFSGIVSFIIVRRDPKIAGAIDLLLMVPYLIPGVVMAIGYVVMFRNPLFDITGTGLIIVLIFFIRRLPYGVRSTTTNLRQIKPSMEEAAINLGASPLTTFLKITLPLIMPGLIVGSLMSFITAINELSSTLILYTARTITMPVKIYVSVIDGEFGIAAALSSILLISTGICVYLVFRLSGDKETSFV